tara:strand:+ start:399 stop:815 length:417 start_codon:yes stop_codon:yes gene_type:complete
MLRFEIVLPTPNQVDDLYSLLSNRSHSISHNKLPSKKEHSEFVSQNPYLEWYLIYKDIDLVGSVNVHSDNSIGINVVEPNKDDLVEIISYIKSKYKPLPPIKSVRREDFFVNVASDNLEFIKIFQQLEKKEIQRSFVI